MAEDKDITDIAEQGNAAYGMKNLISSLIHDVMEADLQAADDFVEIVENKAVETYTDSNGEKRKRLKTVDYELVDEEGKVQVVTIPYISLLALPSLRISEATFELEAQMEVVKSTKTEETTTVTARKRASQARVGKNLDKLLQNRLITQNLPEFRFFAATPQDSGTAASSGSSEENSKQFTNVKVSIKLAPTVLPNGVRGLLQYAGSNIRESEE